MSVGSQQQLEAVEQFCIDAIIEDPTDWMAGQAVGEAKSTTVFLLTCQTNCTSAKETEKCTTTETVKPASIL